jgi:hypothetical protein
MIDGQEFLSNFSFKTLTVAVAVTTPCVSPTKRCPSPISAICQAAQVSVGVCDGNVSLLLWLRPGEEVTLNKFVEELDDLMQKYLAPGSRSAR